MELRLLGSFFVVVLIKLALNDAKFKDFEDEIQYYSALESQCQLLVTRNMKVFKHSKIPVLSPKENIAKRKSE